MNKKLMTSKKRNINAQKKRMSSKQTLILTTKKLTIAQNKYQC